MIMRLGREIRHRLREDRERIFSESANFMLNGDTEKAKEAIEKVTVYDRLLEASAHHRQLLWSFGLVFFCLLIAAVAPVERVKSTEVSLDLLVDGVKLSTTETGLSAALRSSNCYIDNLTTITSLHPDITHTDRIPFQVSFQGRDVVLKNVRLSKAPTIELEKEANTLRLFLKADTVSGNVSMAQGELKFADNKVVVPKALAPSLFVFEAVSGRRAIEPVRIDINGDIACDLRWLTVDSLLFVSEDPVGSGRFVSTIRSGIINLFEIGREITLTDGDFIRLEILKSDRLTVEGDTNLLHLRFEGLVSKISEGSDKFRIDQMPTYLEYIYHNQRLALFWSCVVFLWTLLWGIRNFLFK